MNPFYKDNMTPGLALAHRGLGNNTRVPQIKSKNGLQQDVNVLGTILLCVTKLRWDWNGLRRIVLTFHNRGLY